MKKLESEKVSSFYKSAWKQKYGFGLIGFLIGVKVCDLIFYDPIKHDREIQMLEEEFWALNGEPTHLKPEIVQSIVNPNKVRKSWIQIIYGKDQYLTKDQYS